MRTTFKKYRLPLSGMLVGVLFVRIGVYSVQQVDYWTGLGLIFLSYAAAIALSMGIIFKSRASGAINLFGFIPAFIAILSLCSMNSPNWIGITRYLATRWTLIVGVAITGISFAWFIYTSRQSNEKAKLKNDEKAKSS